jgi:hypothetical protein
MHMNEMTQQLKHFQYEPPKKTSLFLIPVLYALSFEKYKRKIITGNFSKKKNYCYVHDCTSTLQIWKVCLCSTKCIKSICGLTVMWPLQCGFKTMNMWINSHMTPFLGELFCLSFNFRLLITPLVSSNFS